MSEFYQRAADQIKNDYDIYEREATGSNWRFRRVAKLDIYMVEYNISLGMGSHIPTPKKLAGKKGIVNPKNDDDKCIIYCIAMAQLFRKDLLGAHPERITPDIKKQAEELDLSDVNFPAWWKDIATIEKNNPDIKINVFGCEKGIRPLRHSKDEDAIDLLLISDGEKKHFCWIKNLNRLVVKKGHSQHLCKRCLNHFTSPQALSNHKKECNLRPTALQTFPEPGTKLSWGMKKPSKKNPNKSYADYQCQKQLNRSMQVPVVFYADFESRIQPVDTCQPTQTNLTRKKFKNTPQFHSVLLSSGLTMFTHQKR